MCFVKAPKPKPPPEPPTRADATQASEDAARRLQYRRGAEASIRSGALGDPNYGKAASKPVLGV